MPTQPTAVNVKCRRRSVYDPRLGEDVETWVAYLTWPGAKRNASGSNHHSTAGNRDGVVVEGATLGDVFNSMAALVESNEEKIVADITSAT